MSSDKNMNSSSSSSDENEPKSPKTFKVENFYRKKLRASTLNPPPKKETNSSGNAGLTDDSVRDTTYVVSGQGSTDSQEIIRRKRIVYRSPVKGNKPVEPKIEPKSKKRKMMTYAEVVKYSSSDEEQDSTVAGPSRKR